MRYSETEILWEVEKRLLERLPMGWSLGLTRAQVKQAPGASLTLSGPGGEQAKWAVEAKIRIFPKDVPTLLQKWQKSLLVAAPYLGRSTRESLASAGISYCDTTGNLRLLASRPAVWVEAIGAKENPWKDAVPLSSLRGRAASRVVRAVCDSRPPFKIRDLASIAKVSPATASRVAELLEREALVTRDGAGTILDVRWPEILARWTQDYGLLKTNRVRNYLEPRGLAALTEKLGQFKGRISVTGSLAVPLAARVAPPRLAIVYVENVSDAAQALGLTAVDTGANVLLIEGESTVVFEGIREQSGLPCAALSQVAADLLTAPGRGPSEAEALLTWMMANEDAWRS